MTSSADIVTSQINLPECWGHRGASAVYPENTLASFEAAMRDGAEGIESDVHVTIDDVVVMFHDPSLERTTGMNAIIRESNWNGEDGIHKARTLKAPHQAIPTFAETIDLLMKPENRHVKFNVDVKIQNDPDRLFRLMHQVISKQEDWETELAPRILLGLWHPKFVVPSKTWLGYLRRSHIGISPDFAKTWFWEACDTFSMSFASLTTIEGESFRRACKQDGKKIMVWTVNSKEEMMQCVHWGVDVILTDFTRVWLELRSRLSDDFDSTSAEAAGGPTFLWTNWKYYWPAQLFFSRMHRMYLLKYAGPFEFTSGTGVGVTA